MPPANQPDDRVRPPRSPWGTVRRRLLLMGLTGTAAAIAVGTLAPSPGMLLAGVLAIGLGIMAALYYVLAGLPAETACAAVPADQQEAAISEESAARLLPESPSAQVIPFPTRRG